MGKQDRFMRETYKNDTDQKWTDLSVLTNEMKIQPTKLSISFYVFSGVTQVSAMKLTIAPPPLLDS